MTAISSTTDDDFLTSLGIKSATPFNWSIDEQQANTKPIKSTSNEQFIPSGFDVIKNFIQDNSNNDTDKQILKSLLEDANVNLPSTPESTTTNAKSNNTNADDFFARDVSIKGLSDRAVAEHTLECKTSLFGSILRLFDKPNPEEEKNIKSGVYNKNSKKKVGDNKKDNDVIMTDANSGSAVVSGVDTAATATSTTATTDASIPTQPAATSQVESTDPMIMTTPILSTAEIVRTVHLAAKPGDIPLSMDSKEYTLAVLSFLSSYIPYLHENESEYKRDTASSQEGWQQLRDTLPILPLLKTTNPDESLELRCYGRVKPLIKLGQTERKDPDSMDSNDMFRKKVLTLERIFSSSLPYAAPSTSERLTTKLSSASSSTKVSESTEEAEKKKATAETSLPSFEKYCPRRKLVPHIDGGYKEELTLMISGHMQQPQHTPGPTKGKAKVKSKSPATVGKEKDSAKRKVDTASDDSLHQSKKAKGMDI